MQGKSILLFDGVCNLCNAVVQFIIRNDKKRKFLFGSLQSAEGQKLLNKYNLKQQEFDTLVLIEGDKYYTKSTAALRIARKLGGFKSLAYAFIIIPKPIRNWVYDRVAKSRYKVFGRREECMVPTPDLKNLFLEAYSTKNLPEN